MASGNPKKVVYNIAKMAIDTGKDRNMLYSECVRASYTVTGKLSPGFDNKDLQAWIDLNYSYLFDEKGKRIK